MNLPPPMYIPTWPGPEAVGSKKTASPGLRLRIETRRPARHCSCDVLGILTPIRAQTYCSRPEQSKPEGDSPPQAYGVPRKCSASAMAPRAAPAALPPFGITKLIPCTLPCSGTLDIVCSASDSSFDGL